MRHYRVAVLGMVLGLTGCAPASIHTAKLDQPFTLHISQRAQIDELQIRFIAVAGDSRCPSDVVCVWPGNATIKLGVALKESDETVITLNSTVDPKEALYAGFRIQFIALKPYPLSTQPINPAEYRVTLRVSKLP